MRNLGFYDGKIVPLDRPVIRLDDRAYQFGDGVYDAWVVVKGRHVLRTEHLDRFDSSAKLLGITPCYSRAQLEGFSDALLKKSGIRDGFIYFQWSRGVQSPRSHVYKDDLRPLLTGFIRATVASTEVRSIAVSLEPDERQHFCHIKTLNLLGSVRAINEAHKKGFDDALFVRNLEGTDVVTEGTRSNAFALRGETLFTAPLGPYLLPGITRAVVLDLAPRLGLKVELAFKSPEFFCESDAVFYTSASGLVAVSSVNQTSLASASNAVFRRLVEAYRSFVETAVSV